MSDHAFALALEDPDFRAHLKSRRGDTEYMHVFTASADEPIGNVVARLWQEPDLDGQKVMLAIEDANAMYGFQLWVIS